jgi:hypothetical protein
VLSRSQDLALAGFEVAAIAVIAVAPVPMAPAVLLGVAALALAIRGSGFAGPPGAGPVPALVGLALGAAALAVSIVLAGPLVEGISGRGIEWNQEPAVRGSAMAMIAVVVLTVAGAVAAELAFRGWVAPRVAALWPAGGAIGAVVVAAVAEALVVPGTVPARVGVLVVALGLGALWAGSGRRLGAPLACRLVFEVGATLLAGLRVLD